MAKIEKFEDLICWQKSRELVKEIYRITNTEKFSRDFALRDQARRAAISSMLNISEGFARRTNKEFSKFLYISHGSIAEVQSAMYIALDLSYIDSIEFERIYNNSTEVSKIISGLLKKLRE